LWCISCERHTYTASGDLLQLYPRPAAMQRFRLALPESSAAESGEAPLSWEDAERCTSVYVSKMVLVQEPFDLEQKARVISPNYLAMPHAMYIKNASFQANAAWCKARNSAHPSKIIIGCLLTSASCLFWCQPSRPPCGNLAGHRIEI
jgi:hypothetical protein